MQSVEKILRRPRPTKVLFLKPPVHESGAVRMFKICPELFFRLGKNRLIRLELKPIYLGLDDRKNRQALGRQQAGRTGGGRHPIHHLIDGLPNPFRQVAVTGPTGRHCPLQGRIQGHPDTFPHFRIRPYQPGIMGLQLRHVTLPLPLLPVPFLLTGQITVPIRDVDHESGFLDPITDRLVRDRPIVKTAVPTPFLPPFSQKPAEIHPTFVLRAKIRFDLFPFPKIRSPLKVSHICILS